MEKIFLYKQENNKIYVYNISLNSNTVEVESGILGKNISKKVKEFASYKSAKTFFDNLYDKKTDDDYEKTEEIRYEALKKYYNLMADLDKKGFAKKVYLPKIRRDLSGIDSSKFGGIPFIKINEEYPLCPCCEKPLTLLVQLNLDTINPDVKKTIGIKNGMIQLFYCVDEDEGCGEDDDNEAYFLRYLKSSEIVLHENNKIPENTIIFPEKVIFDWLDMGYEYPSEWDENQEFKASSSINIIESNYTNKIPEDFLEQLMDEDLDLDDINYLMNNLISSGDKIGGNPYWIQWPRHHYCNICNQELSIVMQIASEDNIPYMFSDGGIGHIYICKKHKNEIYFYWDCH
ncbi:MAG: DUF1963 domain-containing protein [Candidatus Sericytochromatia bacterium]